MWLPVGDACSAARYVAGGCCLHGAAAGSTGPEPKVLQGLTTAPHVGVPGRDHKPADIWTGKPYQIANMRRRCCQRQK